MTVSQDELWIDMVQFDARLADRVWDGDLCDPDAPGWYTDVGSLIRRARGPAESDELVDEPEVVATMHQLTLGATVVSLPRRTGVRVMGRAVAMKAAVAATTAGMVGVAAATTTGIVATVAATMVVPAINQHVVPMIGDKVSTAIVSPTGMSDRGHPSVDCVREGQTCTAHPADGIVVDAPAAPAAAAPEPSVLGTQDATGAEPAATATDPEPEDTWAPTTTTTESEPVTAETASTEPAPDEPMTTDPAAVPPAAEPANPMMAPTPGDPAAPDPAAPPDLAPADPGPPAATGHGPADEVAPAPAPEPAPAVVPAPGPTFERVPHATSSGHLRAAPNVAADAHAVGGRR